MREQTREKSALEKGTLGGWFDWATRHPGFLLLGALAVTLLAAEKPPEAEDANTDSCDEVVPLFI